MRVMSSGVIGGKPEPAFVQLPPTVPSRSTWSFRVEDFPQGGWNINTNVPLAPDYRKSQTSMFAQLGLSDDGVPFTAEKCMASSKLLNVFSISIATVIGPTPPGTGVRKPATLRTCMTSNEIKEM